MKIAIDASRTTRARVTGTERYALEMLRALIRLNDDGPQHLLTLYFREPPSPDLLPASPHVRTVVLRLPRLWTHLHFAAALAAARPDVTWVPAHTLPLVFPGRAVVTVHDLGFRHFPDAHPPAQRRYLDWTTRISARRARLILADSAATAHDLTHFYGTPASRIRIIYPGFTAPTPGNIDAVRLKYGLPARYFLFVGTLQPRKNIARLTAAHAQIRAELGSEAPDLVLAGAQGWCFDDAWVPSGQGIHLPGYIDEADKGALYAGALAFVFPSLYEGFGFPVLEAMACGTPVICSNSSSLPELAGDAALLIDPLDSAALARAMRRLIADADLRASLIARGQQRLGVFTWERAAAGALAALEAAAE